MHLLRDGEVVLYRRQRSRVWQCRYKLTNGAWQRQSTHKTALEHAVRVACDMYDEARFTPDRASRKFPLCPTLAQSTATRKLSPVLHRASKVVVPGYRWRIIGFTDGIGRQAFLAQLLKFQPQCDAAAFFRLIGNSRIKRRSAH